MKIALDPYMLRDRPFGEVCRIAAEIGYDSIELSPRPDFIPFFTHPRADRAKVAEFRAALSDTGIELASILPLYRWSSPDEDERLAAVRYWKRAIQLCVDVGCRTMNSEFNGRPEQAARSEAQFWRSMEELLPIFEREGIKLNLEAHPDDFIEENTAAVDLVRGDRLAERRLRLLHAPHLLPRRRHRGDDPVCRTGPGPGPRGRRPEPPRVVGPPLHRQPAGLDRPRPPAPRHRAGRGRFRGGLRRAPRDRHSTGS